MTTTNPTTGRLIRYGDVVIPDPGREYGAEAIKTALLTYFPELANCRIETKTDGQGREVIEFIKQATTKGGVDEPRDNATEADTGDVTGWMAERLLALPPGPDPLAPLLARLDGPHVSLARLAELGEEIDAALNADEARRRRVQELSDACRRLSPVPLPFNLCGY